MVDKIEHNKAIAELAKAYSQLKPEERTAENAMLIFNKLNTVNANASKDKLDNVDKIDEYFKDVMGLTVMKGVTKDEFLENIDDWVEDLAAYEAPEPEEKVEMPFKKVDSEKAEELAGKLIKALSCDSWFGDWWGDLWFEDSDRYEEAFELFKAGEDGINAGNIVEVLESAGVAKVERFLYYLDDDQSKTIRSMIKRALVSRAQKLERSGFLSNEALTLILEKANDDDIVKHAGFEDKTSAILDLFANYAIQKDEPKNDDAS